MSCSKKNSTRHPSSFPDAVGVGSDQLDGAAHRGRGHGRPTTGQASPKEQGSRSPFPTNSPAGGQSYGNQLTPPARRPTGGTSVPRGVDWCGSPSPASGTAHGRRAPERISGISWTHLLAPDAGTGAQVPLSQAGESGRSTRQKLGSVSRARRSRRAGDGAIRDRSGCACVARWRLTSRKEPAPAPAVPCPTRRSTPWRRPSTSSSPAVAHSPWTARASPARRTGLSPAVRRSTLLETHPEPLVLIVGAVLGTAGQRTGNRASIARTTRRGGESAGPGPNRLRGRPHPWLPNHTRGLRARPRPTGRRAAAASEVIAGEQTPLFTLLTWPALRRSWDAPPLCRPPTTGPAMLAG